MLIIIRFIVTFLLLWGITNAQELNLTFLPVSAENPIDSIKVINITTSEMNMFYGTYSILLTTAINNLNESSESIHVYTNILNNETLLAYHSTSNKTIYLSVCDITGKKILFGKYSVSKGVNQFKISLHTSGLYLLSLVSDSFKDARKIILSGDVSHKSNEIIYEGINDPAFQEKSVETENADLYHFYIYSGDMITKIADRPSGPKTYDVEFFKCQDASGRNYPVVKIGGQWWMADNLRYLPNVFKTTDNSVLNYSYCYVFDYNGYGVNLAMQSENYQIYGVLYNWLAANEYCPEGWHIPDKEEWMDLATFIDNRKGPFETSELIWYDIGEYLKSNKFWTSNEYNTDEYGFSGLPGGVFTREGNQFAEEGKFKDLEETGCWWSTYSIEMHVATVFTLGSNNPNLAHFNTHKSEGISVRCVKD